MNLLKRMRTTGLRGERSGVFSAIVRAISKTAMHVLERQRRWRTPRIPPPAFFDCPSPTRRRSFGSACFVLLFALTLQTLPSRAQPPSAPALEPEYVILSGGPSLMKWEHWKQQPHDLWWMNFIQAARLRIQEMLANGVPPERIAWLVYAPSYRTRGAQDRRNYIADIATLRDTYRVRLKFFEHTSEVFDYLNKGKPRNQVKIADFEYFGHSNRACWMFDYSNNIDSASKAWLHDNQFDRIEPAIFAKDAWVKSWGCHTAEEMSQKFRKATGIRMWGATGRTQYNTETLPSLASADGRWRY